jgi:hypothetical protein
MRLIYYSLATPDAAAQRSDDSGQSAYEQQWVQSIRSLRAKNATIPVTLFVFNGISEEVRCEADLHQVQVILLGGYREWLMRAHPRGEVLALYPTLHKFLVLAEADTTGLTQALYVDCDTFFYDDPELLFESADPVHWSAREELRSRLCPMGYDPANIDEDLIEQILAAEGLRWVAPFNSGVCLLNNGIWNTFRRLRGTFLDVTWRLLVGRHCWGGGAISDPHIRSAVIREATPHDILRAIPYPSGNTWILEEIAVWLTLAHVPNLTQAIFAPAAVSQGYECIEAQQTSKRPVVAHYFSSLQREFFRGQQRM